MNLGELITTLTALKDTVSGVDAETDVTFTDGAYTADVDDVLLTLRVASVNEYGHARTQSSILLKGTET